MKFNWGLSEKEIAATKAAVIACLQKTSAYNITIACETLGINKIMVYQLKKQDPDFAEAVDSAIAEHRASFVDIAEKTLREAVERGDMTATIFALKTLGRSRGYEQSAKLTVETDKPQLDIHEAARRLAFALNTAGIKTLDGNFSEVLESPKLIEAGIITPTVEVEPEMTAADVVRKMKESKAQMASHRKRRREEGNRQHSETLARKKAEAVAKAKAEYMTL